LKELPEDIPVFHDQGVDIVCLTLGSKGVKLSQKGKILFKCQQLKLIMDSTGAGDAFGLDFICFYQGKSINECLDIALKLAALKLQNVGRLPDNINILSKLYKSVWKEIIKILVMVLCLMHIQTVLGKI
jgi:fructokinase